MWHMPTTCCPPTQHPCCPRCTSGRMPCPRTEMQYWLKPLRSVTVKFLGLGIQGRALLDLGEALYLEGRAGFFASHVPWLDGVSVSLFCNCRLALADNLAIA